MASVQRALVAGVAILALAAPGWAQPAPPVQQMPRADVSGTVGWLAVEKTSREPYFDDRWHHTAFGGAGAGWYWTPHLKTEVDFGVGGDEVSYDSRQVVVNDLPAFVTTESRFSRRVLGVSQQYQFYDNAWFHPHVAAGANVTWERITDVTRPIVVFDRPGPGRVLAPERVEGPRTEVKVTPFVATGFKAYVTPRAFFRSDIRFGIRSGIDDVLIRAGFGIDF